MSARVIEHVVFVYAIHHADTQQIEKEEEEEETKKEEEEEEAAATEKMQLPINYGNRHNKTTIDCPLSHYRRGSAGAFSTSTAINAHTYSVCVCS